MNMFCFPDWAPHNHCPHIRPLNIDVLGSVHHIHKSHYSLSTRTRQNIHHPLDTLWGNIPELHLLHLDNPDHHSMVHHRSDFWSGYHGHRSHCIQSSQSKWTTHHQLDTLEGSSLRPLCPDQYKQHLHARAYCTLVFFLCFLGYRRHCTLTIETKAPSIHQLDTLRGYMLWFPHQFLHKADHHLTLESFGACVFASHLHT